MINIRSSCRVTNAALLLLVGLAFVPASAECQNTPAVLSPIPGVADFRQVSDTVALAGNVSPSAMKALAELGVATVISLRTDNEPGFDAAATEAAARDAGLHFVTAPFDPDAPEAASIDRALAELDARKATKTVVFCRTRQRAAVVWLARRVLHDGAKEEDALAEAKALGLVRADLEAFARGYIAERSAARPPR